MKQPLERSNSPIFWLLFGGGGMVAALFGPVLVLITGLLVPLGLMSGLMSYTKMLAFAQHWVGKGFLFVVVALLIVPLLPMSGGTAPAKKHAEAPAAVTQTVQVAPAAKL